MVKSYDIGSLPLVGDFKDLLYGASDYGRVVNESTKFFENKVFVSFMDKVKAGIDIPNYPQYRDMNKMFFDLIEGIEKIDGGYIETALLRLKEGKRIIPEVSVIKNRSQEIHEKLEEPFQLRICLAGPYTMSSLLDCKDKFSFIRIGNLLAQMAEHNIFSSKHGRVVLVSLDEPVFGFVDDPLLDHGSEGRENLLRAWELITQRIRAKGAQSSLHLHSTSDELFWEVENLNLIESHFRDSFYQSKSTKDRLESTDKFLKASITVTDFDQLIKEKIIAEFRNKINEISINEKIVDTWKSITKKQIDPTILVENIELMKKRLLKIVGFFGENRVPYAGPECGLKGFPTYESALECLKRVAEAIKTASD